MNSLNYCKLSSSGSIKSKASSINLNIDTLKKMKELNCVDFSSEKKSNVIEVIDKDNKESNNLVDP